ncbi:hypothetical protein CPIN18021_0243 [Campylobacter pinnipediorum subsp. caledonicus]|uniref:Uncharacterized protein n=1 Tax=Campylobacter pinnipediorum subsp. caledonicus TaxID=1874362 RepID=A0A1S6U5Z8_9BACT|nr:hypothetical protein [Campylobacter pinnipediorum]AQW87090.1 hypothetical protein CPIN18021_0243 [Campylobacter pinnipediorum subsp. caledonicus]
MARFNINYLPNPTMSSGAGTGMGIAAIGESISRLGDIGLQRKKREEEKAERERLVALQNKEYGLKERTANAQINNLEHDNKIKDKELRLRSMETNSKVNYYNANTAEAKQKARFSNEDRIASISLVRKMFPDETKGLSDNEVILFGNKIDKQHKEYQKHKAEQIKNTGIDPDEYKPISLEEYKNLDAKYLRYIKSDKSGNKYISRSAFNGEKNTSDDMAFSDSITGSTPNKNEPKKIQEKPKNKSYSVDWLNKYEMD